MRIALKETSIEFNYLTQCEMLTGGLIKSPNSLYELQDVSQREKQGKSRESYHESIVVGSSDGHSLETIVDQVKEFGNCLTFAVATLVEHLNQLPWYVQCGSKFNDSTRTEAMGMEVIKADWHNLDLDARIVGHRSESHNGDASFKGK